MGKPDFADATPAEIAEIGRNVGATPWLFDDDCFEAGQHRIRMLARRRSVKLRALGSPVEPVSRSPVRLVEPQSAGVIDDLVAAFFDRDRFEQVVIDEDDEQITTG